MVIDQQQVARAFLHQPVGSFYHGGETVFTVWAPLHHAVDLIFDEQVIPMEKDAFGYWSTRHSGVNPGDRYWFRIDGKDRFPDPASMAQPQGVHGASMVIDRSFAWTDSSWTGLPLDEMIIYELHVGTFTKEGTFDGVIGKLPYLKELGVNAIELMPVAQFPGSRNWGYDGVFPFAAQHSYGGANGLKRLVNAAHKEDIAVILDVVYNHQGPEGNYLSQFGPYFTDKYKTGWGAAINFDDAYADGVRQFYLQNALQWLGEFHIDGLRLDAVHAIWDYSAQPFASLLHDRVQALEKKTGKTKVLIAEFDLNNPRYIQKKSVGGYGLDGQWSDEFHHALHSLVTGERDGYYEDFGEPKHLAKAFRDSYVYTGEYSVHRKKNFGVWPANTTYSQFVVFAQNHDQVGNRFPGDRLTTGVSFETLKLVAATYILSPHVPMLFMGEEYGEDRPFQYFISHTDDALVELVREGRKKEFSYFQSKGGVPDPQAESTFEACKLSWEYTHDHQRMSLLHMYRWLIGFRKVRQAMQGRERKDVVVLSDDDDWLLIVQRTFGNDEVIVFFNFSETATEVYSPVSYPLLKIFDSADGVWSGPGESNFQELEPEKPVVVQGRSVIIFER